MCFVVWWWWLVWCLFGFLVLFFGWLGFWGFGLVCFLFILYCYNLYIYLWNKTTGPDKGPSRGPAHEGWVLADPDPLQCDVPHLVQINAQVMPWPSHTAAPPSIPAAEKILCYIDISTSPPPFFAKNFIGVCSWSSSGWMDFTQETHTRLQCTAVLWNLTIKSICTWSVWLWLFIRWWSGKLQTSCNEWAFFLTLLMDVQQLEDIFLAAINSLIFGVWKSRLRNDWKCCHHCAASRLRTHHLCITSTHWHWPRQLCAEPWVQARLKKSLQVHSLVEKQKAAPGGEDDGMKLGVGL